jgi:hypothetical protein
MLHVKRPSEETRYLEVTADEEEIHSSVLLSLKESQGLVQSVQLPVAAALNSDSHFFSQ